jgi:SAM-dependent MidA family methyltransferase
LPIADVIRERGPLTVAAFMELALYDPELGYYARAVQRSGRAGDFFTSVDVGPLFGELLEVQIEEMARLLAARPFDLVEAGAGNGRLSADILRAAMREHPDFYDGVRLHLVEASRAARSDQRATLADVADRLTSSELSLPASFEGVLVANELLDAMPTHQVVMREDGLREVYVSHRSSVISRPSQSVSRQSRLDRRSDGSQLTADDSRPTTDDWRLTTVEGPPSTPALADYLDRVSVRLEPGWRVEVNLRAVEWIRDAARRLRRGFIIIIDYGHEARELYSASHSGGTLTTFFGHHSAGSELRPDAPAWVQNPGEQDITAHVDFTSVRAAAEVEGMQTLAFLDQTYFLMGLLPALRASTGSGRPELVEGRNQPSAIRSFKTLVMPGGLGSSHKVLILGKNVGTHSLKACSYRMRVT